MKVVAVALAVALAAPAHADTFGVTWRAPNCVTSPFAVTGMQVWSRRDTIARRDLQTGIELAPLAIPTGFTAAPFIQLAWRDTIVVGDLAQIVALDAGTGVERWRHVRERDTALRAIGDDVVLVTPVAVERLAGRSGKVLWHVAQKSLGSARTSDARVYLATRGALVALDAATGRLAWKTPVAIDDASLIGAGETTAQVIAGRAILVFDATTGRATTLPFAGGPYDAVAGPGVIYTTTRTALVALDATTGKPRWQVAAREARVEAVVAGAVFVREADTLHARDPKIGAIVASYGVTRVRQADYAASSAILCDDDRETVALALAAGAPDEVATLRGIFQSDVALAPRQHLTVTIGDTTARLPLGPFELHVTGKGTYELVVLGPDGTNWGGNTDVRLTGKGSYALGTIEVGEPPDDDGD